MPRIQGRRTGFFLTERNGNPWEQETFTCGHCQHVTAVGHGQVLDELGGMCLKCMRPCCKQCMASIAAGGGCDPFEAKFDRAEKEARRVASFSTDLEQRINARLERARFLDQLESERRA